MIGAKPDPPKVISLRAQPQRAALLGFETGGVLDDLGTRIVPASQTSIEIGTSAGPLVVSPDGKRVYVASNSDNTVYVIDAIARSLFGPISAAFKSPVDLAISPDGATLYVVNEGGVLNVINVAHDANSEIANLVFGASEGSAGDFLSAVAVDPAGTHVFVADWTAENVKVIDTATNTVVHETDLPTRNPTGDEGGLLSIAVSADGTRAYVGNAVDGSVTIINTLSASYPVVGTFAAGDVPIYPTTLAISPDGGRLYVGEFGDNPVLVFDISTEDPELIETLPAEGNIALFSNGRRLYVVGPDGLSVVDTADSELVGDPIPVEGSDSVAVSPDGNTVYVSSNVAKEGQVWVFSHLQRVTTIQLGDSVTAFDLDQYCTEMRSAPTTQPGDESQLLFGTHQILDDMKGPMLAKLRNEPIAAALDRSITSRQNAYWAKYGHIYEIAEWLTQFYGPASDTSKLGRLNQLSTLSDQQTMMLQLSYDQAMRTGVVGWASRTTTSGSSDTTGNETGTSKGHTYDTTIGTGNMDGSQPLPDVPPDGSTYEWNPRFDGGPGFEDMDLEQSSHGSSSTLTSSSHTQEGSGSTTEEPAWRVPYIENQATYQRAQVSLIDERAAQVMQTLHYDKLKRGLTDELTILDIDVFQLQIAYLQTLLVSPIDGVVTGIYKQSGETVQAGEPVVRVEDNSTVLLSGELVYRGPIAVGMTFTVHTNLFGDPNSPLEITGTVVAAAGAGNDDRWEIVVRCANTAPTPLPLHYRFDYNHTTVTLG